MDMFLNFNEVDAVVESNGNFFKPGLYEVKVAEVKIETHKDVKKYLGITFQDLNNQEAEVKMTEKFWLQGETLEKTKKMLGRLQFMHEKLFGGPISQGFTSLEQLEEYWKTKLMGPKSPKKIRLVVNGEQAEDGKVWARLPFAGFIVALDEENFTVGAFEEGSPEYKNAVKKSKTTPAGVAMATAAGSMPVLNSAMGASNAAAPWEV